MAPYATKYGEMPKVLDLCDSITLNYERFLKYRRDLLSSAYWIEKMKVKNYEGTIPADFNRSLVVSAVDKEALVSYAQSLGLNSATMSSIEVVANGVDLDYFPGSGSGGSGVLKYNPHRLIFTGTMSYFPNYDGIIHFYEHIFPLVQIQVPDVELYVVGRNPPKGIRGMSHDKSVTVTGFVPDVRPYMSSASIFVCPLRAATGLQNKILEAMAMGLPVIATSKALEGINAIPDQDVLVSDEPEEFAGLIVKLLLDEDLRRSFSVRGRQLMGEKYHWSRVADQLDKIYKEVVK
jgi:glycosyltransferase involved in cell wall biosynthesis